MNIPERIAIHHSASPRGTRFNQVRQWHLDRGWKDIGYNHIILGNGQHCPGRIVPTLAAAVARKNRGTLSVLVMGDNTKTAQRWTQNQVSALVKYVNACIMIWPGLRNQVFGHRDIAHENHPTLCPGLDIQDLADTHNWNVHSYWS